MHVAKFEMMLDQKDVVMFTRLYFNTSTSLTEKSGECDKHTLLKVSELELEPVKLSREMQRRKWRKDVYVLCPCRSEPVVS